MGGSAGDHEVGPGKVSVGANLGTNLWIHTEKLASWDYLGNSKTKLKLKVGYQGKILIWLSQNFRKGFLLIIDPK